MLHRVFRDLDRGFYFDIGAGHTENDSVTRFFYENGWRGINVEPNPQLFNSLRDRPRDLNLNLAIGTEKAIGELLVVKDTGLSTLRRNELDSLISKYDTAFVPVQIEKLSDLWRSHVPPGEDVHFLKIDVEGFELEAITGGDWKSQRPWVVVVEATFPGTERPNFSEWEPILLANGYIFVYFDGLNRYYLANEHADRREAFLSPPNVFDGFRFISEVRLQETAQLLELSFGESERARRELELSFGESERARRELELSFGESERARRELELSFGESERARREQENILMDTNSQLHSTFATLDNIVKSRLWRSTHFLRKLPTRRKLTTQLAASAYRVYARSSLVQRMAKISILRNPRITAWLLKALNPVTSMEQSQIWKTSESGAHELRLNQLLVHAIDMLRKNES